MALSTPTVQSDTLHLHSPEASGPLKVESDEWFRWLETATSFAFAGPPGTFTARKEQTGQQRTNRYWRAYRKKGGKLYRAYLGKSQELTLARLNAVAALLAERSHNGAAGQPAEPAGKAARSNPARPEIERAFVSTKLRLPNLNHNLVIRSRLLERLDAARQAKLTLIAAPAGFGKTTLAAEWLRQSGWPVAWLALDPGDNDPSRFWGYLSVALENLRVGPFQETPRMYSLLQPPSVEQMVAGIINQAALFDYDFFLALDDWHAIENPAIHQGLAHLVEHLPARLHLLITSRVDPPLPLARLRARRELVELRAADLRFTGQEAADFLKQVMKLDLTTEQLAVMEARTEGWVAGLQLAGLSMQGLADPEGFIKAFKGSHHFMLDYLTEEVLNRQPEEVQNFLLQTSILKRLTGELVEELTGCQDGRSMLERLAAANLFLVALDQEREWYRYHHLFGEYLQKRLQQEQAEHLPLLHRWAAEWYAENGMLHEATHHALAAQDYETAARLVEMASPTLILHGEVATLQHWLEAIPPAIFQKFPNLNLTYIWSLTISQQINQAQEQLDRFMAGGNTASVSRDEILTLEAIIAAKLGKTARSVELCHQALAVMGPDKLFLRLIILMLLGNGYGYARNGRGHISEAIANLEEAIQLSGSINQPFARLTAMHLLAFAQRSAALLHQAFRTCQNLLQTLKEVYSYERIPLDITAVYLVLGDLYLEWNNLDEAYRMLDTGRALCEKNSHYELEFAFCVFLAQLKWFRQDLNGVEQALKRIDLLEVIYPYASPIKASCLAYRARLWLTMGRTDLAAKWAEGREVELVFSLGEEREVSYLSLVLVLLAQERWAEAAKRLEQLIEAARTAGLNRVIIEASIQLALLHLRLNEPEQAIAVILPALEIAEPENFIFTFSREGEPLALLLETVMNSAVYAKSGSKVSRRYLERLVEASRWPPGQTLNSEAGAPLSHPANNRPGPQPEALPEPLSNRELEVLRMSADGLTGQEIAGRLVLSLSTVNWHLKNIYGKLGVHNRTQALARARALNLL